MNSAGNVQCWETTAIKPVLVKRHNNSERDIFSPKTVKVATWRRMQNYLAGTAGYLHGISVGLIGKEYQLRGVFSRTAEFPKIRRTYVPPCCWGGIVSPTACQRRSFKSPTWYLGHWLVPTEVLSCATRKQMRDWPFRCQSYPSWWLTGGPIGDNSLWDTENGRQGNKLKKSMRGHSDPLNPLVKKEKKSRWGEKITEP